MSRNGPAPIPRDHPCRPRCHAYSWLPKYRAGYAASASVCWAGWRGMNFASGVKVGGQGIPRDVDHFPASLGALASSHRAIFVAEWWNFAWL